MAGALRLGPTPPRAQLHTEAGLKGAVSPRLEFPAVLQSGHSVTRAPTRTIRKRGCGNATSRRARSPWGRAEGMREIRQDLPVQLLCSPGAGHRRGHLTREEEERVLAAPGGGPSGRRAGRPRVSSPPAATQGQPSSARSFIHSFLQYRPVPGAGDTAEVLDMAVVPACVGLPACGRERSQGTHHSVAAEGA